MDLKAKGSTRRDKLVHVPTCTCRFPFSNIVHFPFRVLEKHMHFVLKKLFFKPCKSLAGIILEEESHRNG
jgi:hypothetical protein